MDIDEVELDELPSLSKKTKSREKGEKIKILYIRLPFDCWLHIAKKALEEQKNRGDVIVDVINDYFAQQSRS